MQLAATAAFLVPQALASGGAIQTSASPCQLESYAYMRVSLIARELGPDGDVFSVALEDLHDQLDDCLHPPEFPVQDALWRAPLQFVQSR